MLADKPVPVIPVTTTPTRSPVTIFVPGKSADEPLTGNSRSNDVPSGIDVGPTWKTLPAVLEP